jgi:UDP-glucose 4-epimerase
MKYFVTGGCGFIGSHLVDRLMEMGSVTVYDNLSNGKQELIAHHIGKKGFKFVKADLLDVKTLTKELKGHDFVFHIAANSDVRIGESKPGLDLEQGPVVTANLLEAMRLNSIKKIAFSSSSVVYGETEVFPTPETYGPELPISLYGAAKLGAEGLITAYCGTYGFQAWIYRFANIIGPRGTHGVLVDFMGKLRKDPKHLEILGDGKQKKSYLTVEECVDSMLFIVKNSHDNVNLYNLGTKDQITVEHIAELLVLELGLKNVKFQYTGGSVGWAGDVRAMLLDTTKLNKLGWSSKLNSEKAVLHAIKHLKKEIWDKK